jgi:threonine dehydrogenase-like Zn-dependent dehydrogenase
MRALHVIAPHVVEIQDLPDLIAGPGQLLVNVERVGICGTDIELYTGEMAYYRSGRTTFPVQLGHEWVGTVIATGAGVSHTWIGKRVTGDTMLGCGLCARCASGKTYLCDDRIELGITDGWGGALAEQMLIPERYAFEIPDSISVAAAAMIEPAGNSLRSVEATRLTENQKLLILGSGTIGLLAAQFALAKNLEVHLAGNRETSLQLARELGVLHVHTIEGIEGNLLREYDAVIDASSSDFMPALALQKVFPGGTVVLIGLSEAPSMIDTRVPVLQDVTIVGILSASPGLQGAIDYFASGAVDPEPLISEVIGFHQIADRLEGNRGKDAKSGPKIHVDPRILK